MTVILDDFHVIHSNKCPTTMAASEAKHFATAVIDSIQSPAIPLLHLPTITTSQPSEMPVQIIGGIDDELARDVMTNAMQQYTNSYFVCWQHLMPKYSAQEMLKDGRFVCTIYNTQLYLICSSITNYGLSAHIILIIQCSVNFSGLIMKESIITINSSRFTLHKVYNL